MYCVKKVTDDLAWVGANDRRLAMFEGVYSVPNGVSYNAYLLMDEKTVLFDTVDKAVRQRFLENVTETLGGRPLDYLVIQHMEPDHSAVFEELVARYPEMRIVCNAKTAAFLAQFFGYEGPCRIVAEGDRLSTGKHGLTFLMAPMVHWPEVMLTYDATDKCLFSADAFGAFGALNGAIFADEVDFERDYMDEARRYYANIVGKYGSQVRAVLDKASKLDLRMICPLHGFVWRKDIHKMLSKYALWSGYQPEERGVMIAYASVYGSTENAAEILACRLRDAGIPAVLYDVSVTPASEIVSAAFRWSHLVFASTTYNAGIFVTMEALLSDLVAHNLQNRTVGIIENGTWAATSGGLIREKLGQCKGITFLSQAVSIKSSVKAPQLRELCAMAEAIRADFPGSGAGPGAATGGGPATVDPAVLFKLSYGLFILTAKDGAQDNGCVINTAAQITSTPLRISIAVSKANHTHDMIVKTGEFALSILSESAPFAMFERFGFHSGRDTDKFADCGYTERTTGGIRYVPEHTNGMIAARVAQTLDLGTHTLFIADAVEAIALSGERSATYQYYFDHIKAKPQEKKEPKKGFICKICGYIYEGDTLPEDFICPVCKHGAEDFEPL